MGRESNGEMLQRRHATNKQQATVRDTVRNIDAFMVLYFIRYKLWNYNYPLRVWKKKVKVSFIFYYKFQIYNISLWAWPFPVFIAFLSNSNLIFYFFRKALECIQLSNKQAAIRVRVVWKLWKIAQAHLSPQQKPKKIKDRQTIVAPSPS